MAAIVTGGKRITLAAFAGSVRPGLKCRVCALSPALRAEIERAQAVPLGAQGHVSERTMSYWLREEHGVNICEGSIANHRRSKHADPAHDRS